MWFKRNLNNLDENPELPLTSLLNLQPTSYTNWISVLIKNQKTKKKSVIPFNSKPLKSQKSQPILFTILTDSHFPNQSSSSLFRFQFSSIDQFHFYWHFFRHFQEIRSCIFKRIGKIWDDHTTVFFLIFSHEIFNS